MLKIAVVLCLLASVCYAQPEPVRPFLPSTFFGRYHAWMEVIDRSGRSERVGQGWRAYNEQLGKGVRNTTFATGTSSESEYKLELYGSEDTVFDVHTVNGRQQCDHYKIGGGAMPSYWNWVENARYDGMAKFPYWDNPAELEWWKIVVSDEMYRLGVFPEDRNKPAVFERRSSVDNWHLTETYESFEAVIPENTDFEIPRICQLQLRKSAARVGSMGRAATNERRMRPGRRPSRIRLSHYRSIALHHRNMRRMRAMAGRRL